MHLLYKIKSLLSIAAFSGLHFSFYFQVTKLAKPGFIFANVARRFAFFSLQSALRVLSVSRGLLFSTNFVWCQRRQSALSQASFFFPPRSRSCEHFLDAFSHLYKRVCPSIRRSVRPSIRRSVGPSVHHTRVEIAK